MQLIDVLLLPITWTMGTTCFVVKSIPKCSSECLSWGTCGMHMGSSGISLYVLLAS